MTHQLKIGSCVLLASVLFACGEDTSDEEPFALESGTYALTTTNLISSTDQCGLLGAYTPPKDIGVKVEGSTVTFNLSNQPSAAANTLPTAARTGNALEVDKEANYTLAIEGTSCVVRIKRNVTGDVVADNALDLTLDFDFAVEPPTTCDAADVGVNVLPCASTYNFGAEKK